MWLSLRAIILPPTGPPGSDPICFQLLSLDSSLHSCVPAKQKCVTSSRNAIHSNKHDERSMFFDPREIKLIRAGPYLEDFSMPLF